MTIIDVVKQAEGALTLDARAVSRLHQEILALEARAAHPAIVEGREVYCPVCQRVRGCSHLAAEIEELRGEVKNLTDRRGSGRP